MAKSLQRLSEHEGILAGWAGIIFSILSLIVIPLSPELAPPLGSHPSELIRYYTDHRTGFLIGNYLGLVAFFPGFIQLAIFSSQIRRADQQEGWLTWLVLSSGTCTYAVGAVVLILFQAMPFLVESRPETAAAVLAIGSIANVGFALFFLVAASFLLSMGWATLVTHLFPHWFAYGSFGVALMAFGTSLGALWISPTWLAAGGLATGIGFFSFFSWTFVLALLQFKSQV